MTCPRLLVGSAACAVVTFAYRYLSFAEFSNDHFVHLSIAQQITRGALPVRDFVERGIPLMAMLSAAAQVVLGEGLRSELVLVASAFAVAAALTFVVAAALSRSVVIAALAVLIPVLAYPVSYSYPKLLASSIGCAAAWVYSIRPSSVRMALVALAIAFAFLLRHDLGLLVGIGVVAMLLARHGWSREWLVETGLVAAVALLMVSPYLLWVQAYQGIGGYVADGFAFSKREAQRANWFDAPHFGVDRTRPYVAKIAHGPVVNVRWQADASDQAIVEAEREHGLTRLDPDSPHSWQYELSQWANADIERLVKDPIAADTNGIDRSTFELQVAAPEGFRAWSTRIYGPGDGLRLGPNAIALLFYLLWLAPIAAAVTLAIRWSIESPSARALLAMVVVLQLAMNVTMLRDPLGTRMRDVVVPLGLLVSYLAGVAWWSPGTRAPRIAARSATVAIIVLVAGSAAALGDARTQFQRTRLADGLGGLSYRVRTIRRTLAPPDQRTGPRSPIYQPVVDYITGCTPPDARLLTLTFAPELFFYTGRAFAGGQVSLSPGYFASDRDASLMLARLSRESVPLVILDSQTEQEMLTDYPRIGAYVKDHYRETARFPISAEKAFVLMARSDAHCGPRPLG